MWEVVAKSFIDCLKGEKQHNNAYRKKKKKVGGFAQKQNIGG